MSTVNNIAAKKTKGRRKIDIKEFDNKINLQVTFAKRRSGLFKKASELSTLCGAEVTLIAFSPTNKVYSFGTSDVNDVIDHYQLSQVQTFQMQMVGAQRVTRARALNIQLNDLLEQLKAEKEGGKELRRKLSMEQSQFWWGAPIETLSNNELKEYKVKLEDLKSCISHQVERQLNRKAIDLNKSP